ncbi:hypothetical protein JaAD80_10810 [Janthinobacterium sp. AD80]|nr:hypothetical protein JaAD80_10810 [Janthinobacterium sp. AD80]
MNVWKVASGEQTSIITAPELLGLSIMGLTQAVVGIFGMNDQLKRLQTTSISDCEEVFLLLMLSV